MAFVLLETEKRIKGDSPAARAQEEESDHGRRKLLETRILRGRGHHQMGRRAKELRNSLDIELRIYCTISILALAFCKDLKVCYASSSRVERDVFPTELVRSRVFLAANRDGFNDDSRHPRSGLSSSVSSCSPSEMKNDWGVPKHQEQ